MPGETTLKNTVIELTRGDYGFFMKVSSQSDAGLKVVNINVSDDEAMALSVLFRRAIGRTYGW